MKLAEIYERIVDERAPVGFRAYDGSTTGPMDAEMLLEIRRPEAIAYIATAPGELGLVRAYVTGALEIHGDIHAAINALVTHVKPVPWSQRIEILRALGPRALRRPAPPPEEAPPPWRRGLRHSKERDAAAISHHYDVSNRFYEIVLGPSMAYTCAVFPHKDATLEEAQFEKFDLVCRKLGLKEGDRLLDVGCGWGRMVMHAAEHFGVEAVGVTLSKAQAEWAQRAIGERGLGERAEVRFGDYRDVTETGFDHISSIGLTEHIGAKNLAAYFSFLASRVKPGGRLLNHTITRADNHQSHRAGKFIDRYVFPDGELEGPGTIASAMHDNGFELRHEENLREHYAMTLREWGANLERGWNEAVSEAGQRKARVWRLYMAASRFGFDRNTIELHQFLGVRLPDDARSEMPLRPEWEPAPAERDEAAEREPAAAR